MKKDAAAYHSFISSTYWTETIGPAASIAAIHKMRENSVSEYVEKIGNQTMGCWQKYAERYELPIKTFVNHPCLAHFDFEHDLSRELRTLYIQLMLERGFLSELSLYVSLAHTQHHVALYAEAINEVFSEIADALSKDEVVSRLKGPAAEVGFRRLL